MKSLRFKSLHLLSELEKKGRLIEFHPNKNLIFGLNHVGKSTITKQIFETLGATPVGKLENWNSATIALLTATVDGDDYLFLRQLSHRAVFSMDGDLLFCSSKFSDWTSFLSSFLDFNLVLSDKNERSSPGDAACMFLPFYINQDGGWTGNWRAFAGLARFRSPAKAIVEYFTQVVPPQYYLAKANLEAEQREIHVLDSELRILNRTRQRLSDALVLIGPRLTAQDFEVEVQEITRQLTTLNAEQEWLRAKAVSLEDSIGTATQQIALTKDALKRYRDDFKFLTEPSRDDLVCPTCLSKYEESFLTVLTFTEDARTLSEMLIRLEEARQDLINQRNNAAAERKTLAEQYQSLERLLETKRGDLRFEDVVQSMGSGAAFGAFDAEDKRLEAARSTHLTKRHTFDEEMKALSSPRRRKQIRLLFQEHYKTSRQKLRLDSKDVSKMQVISRPDVAGSGGPREVLAYHSALWWVSSSADFGPAFSMPIIIDCPAQSGQDHFNMPAILQFIANDLPPTAQVLLAYESDVSEKFDHKIKLDQPRSLMNEADYGAVSAYVLPKLTAMQKALLERSDIQASGLKTTTSLAGGQPVQ